jgi:hypothetical protein
LGLRRRVIVDADHPGLVTVPVTSRRGNVVIAVNLAPYPVTASISIDGAAVTGSTLFTARGHALIPWRQASPTPPAGGRRTPLPADRVTRKDRP